MTVVDLYTIQIIREDGEGEMKNLRHNHDLEPLMAETEENLTDLLPTGYRARIRRWDHPDPDEPKLQSWQEMAEASRNDWPQSVPHKPPPPDEGEPSE